MTYIIYILFANLVLIGEGFLQNFDPAVNFTCNLQNLPCLDQEEWWGPYHMKQHHDTSIRPFRIEFDEEMIHDLRVRLKYHRRFTPPLEGIGFQYGFNTRVLNDWIRYWAESYPFKERERYLNKYPMFKTNIQGLDIHFLWIKPRIPPGKEVVPILIMHGWPGSVREFYEAIPLLTYPNSEDYTLELIIPSLPGFGYSDSAARPGLGASQAAVIMRNLMRRLGFKQFYIQGGDFGGIIGTFLSTLYPKEVLGFHTNWPFILHPTTRLMQLFGAIFPPLVVEPSLEYRLYPLYEKLFFVLGETGYLHEQATKPDTVGVSLTDSPSGLMAYNLEKFNSGLGSINTTGLNTMPRDSIIDHLMFYWAPKSITTAMRLYAEYFSKKHFLLGLDIIPCQVPTWVIQAEHEFTYNSPPMIRVKFPFLVNVTAIPYGGHFLAFETPKVYADDLLTAIAGFRRLRKRGNTALINLQQNQENWSINIPEFFRIVVNLCKHPESWWVKALVFYSVDALKRIFKRFLDNNIVKNWSGLILS